MIKKNNYKRQMMKRNKYIVAIILAVATLITTTSCRDDFADINQDPSSVTQGTPDYLFSQGILEFEPADYPYWFYNASEIFKWIQVAVPTEGITSTLVNGASLQKFKSIDILKYANELEYVLSQMPSEQSAIYQNYVAALNVLCVYMGIFDSDFIGNIPYTEGGRALHGGTLTPKYDKVEDLYSLWLTSLDKDIQTLTTATGQTFVAAQDPVYAGNASRWAKLANSLKLKIAARLISQDKARALAIAKEVAASSVGVMDGANDDFLFNKSIANSKDNNWVYHWENDILRELGGSQTVIDFMVNNRDPRVRFVFRKNDWNSKIVQAFFDAKRQDDVPKYILDNVEYEVNGDGTYQFKSWKGAGEPWVRYQGFPLAFNAAQQAGIYGDWFNFSVQCRLGDKTFYPHSEFQKEMIQGRIDFTLKTAPGDPVIEDRDDIPWYGMYMTTAEVNLYLAEFKLLGADLPGSASDYFNKAVRASVEEYDRMARMNKIPYYGTTYNYDPFEKVIDLQSGEIETMMENEDYQLTGNNTADLEKVYLHQILHFFMQPIDMYSTARRSGVPVLNSTLFPREDYTENQIPTSSIPRRMALSQPSPTDLMFDVLTNSYAEQGYSVGSGDRLNSERVWQDKGAPQWGEGPKI